MRSPEIWVIWVGMVKSRGCARSDTEHIQDPGFSEKNTDELLKLASH
jgi:hypothetical protein